MAIDEQLPTREEEATRLEAVADSCKAAIYNIIA
jgi:hypothetical protein